ncbi:MAG TPA: M23 family metallopeptidase [Gammaproteobacteria bacterium]|nr:M23 family metallopeptidase [Gammaproteobacteria bacterium]
MSQRRVDLGVSLPAVGALLCFLGAFLALAACRGADRGHSEPLPSIDPTAERSPGDAPGVPAARQRAWLEAADIALERPTPVELPHAEWGGFLGQEPNARGIAFTADAGQILEINLARAERNRSSGAIDVELFLVDTRGAGEGGNARDVRLAQLPVGDSSLRFRLPLEATYVVRLKPAPLTDAIYFLQLELGAALPFPVRGYEVKSFFGAPRDQGRRHHEGIDLYAPRRTPVLAVADGQATYRENRLGGHTVWLATATGVSYYYAHLERVAVGSSQRVRTGDVLGYVGDSGNAAEVGPHLHFGIYRWGQGAVDPLPMLEAREFAQRSAGDAPLDIAKLAAAGCAGRPATTTTPFKRCTAAELLKQRPYSVTDGTCPEVAPPCLRMAQAAEPAPLAARSLELELAAPKPVAVKLASAVLELEGDFERPDSPECHAPVDGLPGLCAARASQRVMMF